MPLSQGKSMALYFQEQVELADALPAWFGEVVSDLAERLRPPTAFPCTFAPNSISRKLVTYSFVDGADPAASAYHDIVEYLRDAREWNGDVNTARPLIVAFSRKVAEFDTLAAYHDFGWRMLQEIHQLDEAPWPEGVAIHPTQPFWSFAVAGEQLFVNMSAPLHINRRSRNLGRHFVLVVNPRKRFDVVAGDNPEGHRIRNIIRQRSTEFDGQEHAPQLGSYMKGELEWPQYAIPDTNTLKPGVCPFRQKHG